MQYISGSRSSVSIFDWRSGRSNCLAISSCCKDILNNWENKINIEVGFEIQVKHHIFEIISLWMWYFSLRSPYVLTTSWHFNKVDNWSRNAPLCDLLREKSVTSSSTFETALDSTCLPFLKYVSLALAFPLKILFFTDLLQTCRQPGIKQSTRLVWFRYFLHQPFYLKQNNLFHAIEMIVPASKKASPKNSASICVQVYILLISTSK